MGKWFIPLDDFWNCLRRVIDWVTFLNFTMGHVFHRRNFRHFPEMSSLSKLFLLESLQVYCMSSRSLVEGFFPQLFFAIFFLFKFWCAWPAEESLNFCEIIPAAGEKVLGKRLLCVYVCVSVVRLLCAPRLFRTFRDHFIKVKRNFLK
jgi:hypothetical protein